MLVGPAAQEAEIVANNVVAAEPIVVDVEICSDPGGDWDGKLLEYSMARFEDSAKIQKAIASRFADIQWFYLVARCGDQEMARMAFGESFLARDILDAEARLRLLRPLLKRYMRVFDFFSAVLVADTEHEAEVLAALLDKVEELARQRRVYLINHLKYPAPGAPDRVGQEFFTNRGFTGLKHGTYMLELARGEEQLWKDLKREARTAVRKAGKQGIEVRLGGGEEDFARYYELFEQNRRRDSAKGIYRPVYSYETIVNYLRMMSAAGALQLFCAEKEGKVGSCTVVYYYNGIVSFGLHARADEWHEQKLRDGDVLCWEMIKWSGAQGCRYFDVTGFDANPTNTRQEGIRKFKSKWGGECVYYDYYTKVRGRSKKLLIERLKNAWEWYKS